jgi:hypothetical protein
MAQPPADVWSLGATAYHALAGHPPYEVGDNVMGALYRIVHEEPPRLPDAGWLGPMLECTMDREPSRRWPMHQVRDFLAGGPLAAGGVPTATATAPTAVVTAATSPGDGGAGGTQVLAPAPSPVPPAPAPVHRRGPGGAVLGVLLALAVVAVFLLFAWLFGAFDGNGSSSEADSGPGPTTSESTDTDSTPSAPTSSASDPAEQETAMEAFATSFVQTAISDSHAGFDQLTKDYQRASGGYGGYKKFWDQWDSAQVSDVQADADAGTVSYSIRYEGKGAFSDRVTLDLEPDGDSFLISGATSG